MKRLAVLSGLVLVGTLSIGVLLAQPTLGAIQIEKVKENLYIVTGGRGTSAQGTGIAGNTTVYIADSGVVLIDTKYAGYGKAILDQIKTVTGKPITTIINTHTHADHTGANSEFPRAVEVVAHENTRTNMARMDEFKGANAGFLPAKTFRDTMTLLGGKDRIDLHYFGAGHTNGDAVIVFPALRTAVMGDLFARKWAPLVDSENGGSVTAFPQTLSRAIATIKDVDTVITGHSSTTFGSGVSLWFARSNPVMKWADLQEYADFMRDFVAAAQAAKKAGKSAADAAKALNLPAKYRDYNMARAAEDVQKAYDESKP
jgi:glyoxylase-like metal-dependent hydrolase (beta-lactamase superfamily II)